MKEYFYGVVGVAIHNALKKLLCDKHLYQSVEVDLGPVSERAEQLKSDMAKSEPTASMSAHLRQQAALEEIKCSAASQSNVPWAMSDCHIQGAFADLVYFPLPHINTYCSTCKARPPFNPLHEQSSCVIVPMLDPHQSYSLAYQCQQCRGFPVRFLVRRKGIKLRLVGRDPIEAIPAPQALKGKTKYFSDATTAHHAGQTLAGIFLLRTYVEQFWRRLPAVQAVLEQQPRATGEDQGAAYQATLPTDFKDRFPSLSDIYGRLSAAMHEANADGALFEKCSAEIVKHFEARRLFEL
jgi:hypothetical protein